MGSVAQEINESQRESAQGKEWQRNAQEYGNVRRT